MGSLQKTFYIYGLLLLGSFAAFAFTDYGGLFGCLASIVGIALSRTIVYLFLSFINFSLSIAFDNFLRVDPIFYFYDGTGVTVGYLCLVSTLLYCVIGMLDMTRKGSGRGLLIDFRFPEVSAGIFWPFALVVLGIAVFVFQSESFVLSTRYDAYELQKYPFLEYVGLLIAFMLQAAKGSRLRRVVGLSVALVYIVVCLATSYRMVAIICSLATFMVIYNGRKVGKPLLVSCWLGAYVGLTYISYWRIGIFEVSLENIFGYVNGRMDNTFTGVIETALIYTSIAKTQGVMENLGYLLGALLPVPNSLIPDSMLYIVDAMQRYKFPGGGALAGFIIYFRYLYAIPYLWFIYIAFKRSHLGGIASGMYLILFITVTRWWLYGPYVIFKFFGVLLLIMLVNKFALGVGASSRRIGGLARR
ncbi:hypothetical protein NJG16_18240 [Stenotrophomonas maltophilia]|nr:hypothetical protein [Stenotrophomonas maltophilia]